MRTSISPPGFSFKSTSEGINGSTAKRTWEGQPQHSCTAFPWFPLRRFVPGAVLGPRQAGDAPTKVQQQQQPACKLTFAAKGCRSAACQRLRSAQEPGETRGVCGQGEFRRTASLSGEKEKLLFSCTPGSRGFVTPLPRAFCWDNSKPTGELVSPRITLHLCHFLRCCFTLQVMQFCSAFHTSSSDRLKTSFPDIIQNWGFRKGLLCQTPTTQ